MMSGGMIHVGVVKNGLSLCQDQRIALHSTLRYECNARRFEICKKIQRRRGAVKREGTRRRSEDRPIYVPSLTSSVTFETSVRV